MKRNRKEEEDKTNLYFLGWANRMKAEENEGGTEEFKKWRWGGKMNEREDIRGEKKKSEDAAEMENHRLGSGTG